MSGAGRALPQRPMTAGDILSRLGLTGLTAGAMLFATSATALDKLALGTAGRVLVAGASAPAWSDSGLSYASGVLTVAGSVPGTPAAGQVFVGGGAIKAGGAISGASLTCSGVVTIDGAAATNRVLAWTTGGVLRWWARAANATESGSDAGTPWRLSAYTDAGVLIDNPIDILRAAGGAITLGRPVTCTSDITANSRKFGAAAFSTATAITSASTTQSYVEFKTTTPSVLGYMGFGSVANLFVVLDSSGSPAANFAVGTTALVGSERLRVAGGSAPGTPGSTDVLIGAGQVRIGSSTLSSSGTTGALIVAGGIAANAASYFQSASGSYGLQVVNTNAGTAPGLSIRAGVSTDNALLIRNAADTISLFRVTGAGDATCSGPLAATGLRATTGFHEGPISGGIAFNAYYSSGWKYRANGYATALTDNAASGFILQAAPTGVADAAPAWQAVLTGTPTDATFSVPVVTLAATTSLPSLRIPHGTAPSSPTNGDVWTTTAGAFARINGATVTLNGATPGGSDTHVQFNNAGAMAGSADYTWNNTTKALGVYGLGTPTGIQTPVATFGQSSLCTLVAGITDTYGAGIRIDGISVTGAYTITRHNYFYITNCGVAGGAAITDACLFHFAAAAGTHKAVDSNTTKTSPGTVSAWVKININGTVHYMPAYTSKTS